MIEFHHWSLLMHYDLLYKERNKGLLYSTHTGSLCFSLYIANHSASKETKITLAVKQILPHVPLAVDIVPWSLPEPYLVNEKANLVWPLIIFICFFRLVRIHFFLFHS